MGVWYCLGSYLTTQKGCHRGGADTATTWHAGGADTYVPIDSRDFGKRFAVIHTTRSRSSIQRPWTTTTARRIRVWAFHDASSWSPSPHQRLPDRRDHARPANLDAPRVRDRPWLRNNRSNHPRHRHLLVDRLVHLPSIPGSRQDTSAFTLGTVASRFGPPARRESILAFESLVCMAAPRFKASAR